ncbi:YceD family protein, partial [Streptomyces sp. NPDC001274]
PGGPGGDGGQGQFVALGRQPAHGLRPVDEVPQADDAEDDEDRLFVEDGLFDLEPVLRDAVVLALPMQPVCRESCAGLCSECGVRLDENPGHHHDAVDIRWAALQGLADTVQDGEKDNMGGAEAGVDEKQEK